jgi:hypothetical protein
VKTVSKATLAIKGSADQVMAVVQLALEEGVVESVDMSNEELPVKPRAKSSKSPSKTLKIGDKVVVIADRAAYNVKIGDIGTLQEIKPAGKGRTARVKWLTTGTESPVAASLLKKVQKR